LRGRSGGTGFIGVQLAKAYGAGIVATATSGADNIAFCKVGGCVDLCVQRRKCA